MAKPKVQIISNLDTRKWLDEQQAIIYLGIGNHNMFKEWREKWGLPFYIPNGRKIIYKRTDLDAFMEKNARCEMIKIC